MPRIRIAIASHELEVEGSEEFIALYEQAISEMLARVAGSSPQETAASGDGANAEGSTTSTNGMEFGEVFHLLSPNASGTDQILVAGWFVQESSEENTFTTRAANQLLVDQGIKLSNASQSIKNSLKVKRIFKVGGQFRVSRTGAEHVQSLTGSILAVSS